MCVSPDPLFLSLPLSSRNMGNKLSCSCTPLIKKAYKYDEAPFKARREGRLWAEVFHVSAASGVVRWQQVSEDLVPVNIKCVADQPDFIFKITAYNSHIEKILDVTIRQPGTRLGQASECFVYWKDTMTGDTWGLNFTSPLDAKQFRELCSPSYKFSRKASSSYSLRLNEPPSKRSAIVTKRKPQSTPSSPNRRSGIGTDQLQCTCMTVDTLHKQKNGRVRYTASANTLPKSFRQDSAGSQSTAGSTRNISAYPSTTSVNAATQQQQQLHLQQQQNPAGGGYYRGGQQVIRSSAGKSQQQVSQQQQQQSASGRSAQYSRAQYAQSSKRSTQSRSFDQPASQYSVTQSQQQQQQQQHASVGQLREQKAPPKECMSFPYQPPYHRSAPSHVNAQVNAPSRAAPAGGPSSAQAAAIAAAQQQQQQQQHSSRSKSSDDVRRQLSALSASDQSADQNMDPNYYKRSGMETRRGQQQQHNAARGPRPTSGPAAWSSPSGPYPGQMGPVPCGDARCQAGQCKMLMNQQQKQMQRQAALKSQPAMHHNASLPSPASTKMQVLDRSRLTRSATGRRRSLERMQCFDYTDLSPTTPETVTIDPAAAASIPAAAATTNTGITASPQSNLFIPTSSDQSLQPPPPSSSSSQQKQQQQRGRMTQRSTSGTTPTPSSSGDEAGTGGDGSTKRTGQQPQSSSSQQQLTNGRPGRSSKSAPPGSGHRSGSPTIKVLQEYEHHLRTALAKGNDADTYSLNTFETILSQSMENVVALMKEVQSEIEAIRREESHYRCTSAFGFRGSVADEAAFLAHAGRNQWSRSYTLPSRGTSLPPSGYDAYHAAMRKASGPLLMDSLSIDGGGMQYLRPQSSFESTASDSRMYLTSSEVSPVFTQAYTAFLLPTHLFPPYTRTIILMMLAWPNAHFPAPAVLILFHFCPFGPSHHISPLPPLFSLFLSLMLLRSWYIHRKQSE